MPQLQVKSGVDQGRQFALTGSIVGIGRHSSNAITLADDRASRHHAELRANAAGFTLVDLGSGNGTLVNGAAITQRDLVPGDEIRIGDTVLFYSGDTDDDVRFRTSIRRSVPETAGEQIVANLGVLYEAATAVSHILDVDELLGRILDLVLPATGADHGGVLLIDGGTGELMPRVVRSHAESSFAFSRTIVDYVRRERQGVLVSDAAADTRFTGGESIARHHLREVIAVPMRGRHDTVGVLVLDTLTSGGAKFTGEHLNLAVALAHQAALAVEETRYYRALLDSERLAAVGQTIAGMSHHIKNIMQGIRFGGDMIHTGLGSDDRELIHKGWGLVEKNQRRIDTLILDMLSYSKDREPQREATDIGTVIEDVLELVTGRAAESSVTIGFQVVGTPRIISCDAEAIHAAILNIIGNALDALDGVETPQIRVELQYETDKIVIQIDDNGPGIPSDQREMIFQPFFSSKGICGTGLGLPVSRKILREHGGDLIIDSASNGGARFVMRLPNEVGQARP